MPLAVGVRTLAGEILSPPGSVADSWRLIQKYVWCDRSRWNQVRLRRGNRASGSEDDTISDHVARGHDWARNSVPPRGIRRRVEGSWNRFLRTDRLAQRLRHIRLYHVYSEGRLAELQSRGCRAGCSGGTGRF